LDAVTAGVPVGAAGGELVVGADSGGAGEGGDTGDIGVDIALESGFSGGEAVAGASDCVSEELPSGWVGAGSGPTGFGVDGTAVARAGSPWRSGTAGGDGASAQAVEHQERAAAHTAAAVVAPTDTEHNRAGGNRHNRFTFLRYPNAYLPIQNPEEK
jgi:hypothetical protein